MLAACRPWPASPARPGAVALAEDLALDLGTSSTQLFVRGTGVARHEPTVIAVERRTGALVDVGRAALTAAFEDPKLELVWPLRNGAVADAAALDRFIGRLIKPYTGGFWQRMQLVATVASSSSAVERRAIRDAAKRNGASSVHLIEHVIATALGAGLPLHEPIGTMVVDVGAGITEAALLSLGAVVAGTSVPSGSADVDAAIRQTMRREYGMIISEATAENIKLAVSAMPEEELAMIEARGRTAIDGQHVTAILERDEVQIILDAHLDASIEAVRATLVQSPPELAQDLFSRGIHLGGGGARLGGLAHRLHSEFGLPVHALPDADSAAILGAGKCLEATEQLRSLFLGEG